MDTITLHDDPYIQFQQWYDQASKTDTIKDKDACLLSTINEQGYPEGRVILLKGLSPEGFVFYTNSHSNKGKSLAATPKASLTFYWDDLGYQVRVVGDVSSVTPQEADAYFATRSRISQLGAWASQQSDPLKNREWLLNEVKKYETKFEGQPVPRPPHWIGYRISPKTIEFWIDGAYRLHDRFVYTYQSNGTWTKVQLNP
jgi:pyridoxamine 5'-phosphate oxidase